jgi:hypothetical protein
MHNTSAVNHADRAVAFRSALVDGIKETHFSPLYKSFPSSVCPSSYGLLVFSSLRLSWARGAKIHGTQARISLEPPTCQDDALCKNLLAQPSAQAYDATHAPIITLEQVNHRRIVAYLDATSGHGGKMLFNQTLTTTNSSNDQTTPNRRVVKGERSVASDRGRELAPYLPFLHTQWAGGTKRPYAKARLPLSSGVQKTSTWMKPATQGTMNPSQVT